MASLLPLPWHKRKNFKLWDELAQTCFEKQHYNSGEPLGSSYAHRTFMDGFAPIEQTHGRPLHTDLFVSALLPQQAFCSMAALRAEGGFCSLRRWWWVYGERMPAVLGSAGSISWGGPSGWSGRHGKSMETVCATAKKLRKGSASSLFRKSKPPARAARQQPWGLGDRRRATER